MSTLTLPHAAVAAATRARPAARPAMPARRTGYTPGGIGIDAFFVGATVLAWGALLGQALGGLL